MYTKSLKLIDVRMAKPFYPSVVSFLTNQTLADIVSVFFFQQSDLLAFYKALFKIPPNVK